jgi:two-component system, LytTR family, sensor kinase
MNAAGLSARYRQWAWIAAIWFGVALFNASQTVVNMRWQGMRHSWVQLFIVLMLSWLPWALATPLVIHLGRRYPPMHIVPLRTWIMHLGSVGLIGLIAAAWLAWLDVLLNPWAPADSAGRFGDIWLPRFFNDLPSSTILYAFILAISFVLDSRQRSANQQTESARLSEQLANAQLHALRRQLEPHFLFNTLNAIAGLVREKRNDAAVSTIAALSDILRRMVSESNRPLVPLQHEIEFLQGYLAIQQVRFAERLRVTMDFPGGLGAAQVPSLVLQPLVENAIKHGIAKRAQGGAIRVAASRADDRLCLSVYNDGPALAEEWQRSSAGTDQGVEVGVGISNLRSRLQILYGNEFQLNLQNQNASGVQASVFLPYREA